MHLSVSLDKATQYGYRLAIVILSMICTWALIFICTFVIPTTLLCFNVRSLLDLAQSWCLQFQNRYMQLICVFLQLIPFDSKTRVSNNRFWFTIKLLRRSACHSSTQTPEMSRMMYYKHQQTVRKLLWKTEHNLTLQNTKILTLPNVNPNPI